MHKAPISDKINIRYFSEGALGFANANGILNVDKYLAERGDARVKDWASWVANGHFKTEETKLRAEAAVKQTDPRPAPGIISYIEMQAVMRMVVLKVMYENKIDVFVNPEQTNPPYMLGGAMEPDVDSRPSRSCCQGFTAILGSPEIDVPAGFVTTTYDPKLVLDADKRGYTNVTGDVAAKLAHPMPMSMMFWSGPGSDANVIKVASAYEAATHHRTPPPMFGPVASTK
jgi:Asp-tRNA(Asn)/Glu-tRNA(Gln) amidotransferase A subunit family amidase